MAYQQITIFGNLGKDVEQRFTPDGNAIATFSVAVSEKYGDKETTEWFSCVAFKKTAEIAGQYLRKGSQVIVIGRLRTSSWDDKETGAKRYKTEVMVDKLQLVGGKRETEQDAPRQASAPAPQSAADLDDDIPFVLNVAMFDDPYTSRALRRRARI